MKKHNINVFCSGKKTAYNREELLQIRNKLMIRLQKDICLVCCKCQSRIFKIVYFYSEDSSFCIKCFRKRPQNEHQGLLFLDLDIKDPLVENWRLSQELQLMYLTHELGVEDTELIAKDMSQPRTKQELQQFYHKIGLLRRFSPRIQEKSEYVDEMKQKQYKMFQNLKQMLEEADNHVLDHMMAELHQRSDQKLKLIVLQKYLGLTEQRKIMAKSFKKLCKQYDQRHRNPQKILSQSSDSDSQSDISFSDSAEFEDLKNKSQNLISKVDELILKYPIHEKKQEIIEHIPMTSPKRYKSKQFKKKLKRGILNSKRIQRSSDIEQIIN